VVGSNLFSILGYGIKAMPRLIPIPNPGSFKKENIGGQIGCVKKSLRYYPLA